MLWFAKISRRLEESSVSNKNWREVSVKELESCLTPWEISATNLVGFCAMSCFSVDFSVALPAALITVWPRLRSLWERFKSAEACSWFPFWWQICARSVVVNTESQIKSICGTSLYSCLKKLFTVFIFVIVAGIDLPVWSVSGHAKKLQFFAWSNKIFLIL